MTSHVYVYRNLKRGRKSRPLYSIMRRGKVIARRHRVLLTDATFVVRPAGRSRVLKEGRKNVHAFVKGIWVQSAWGIDANGKNLPVRVSYNPYHSAHFETEDGQKVKGAGGVLLNEHGLTAAYLT